MSDEVIARICEIPEIYRRSGYRAMIAAVNEAGYRSGSRKVSEAEIAAYLRGHPHLVQEWLGYSEDQRSSPNWYLSPPGGGLNRLGSWRVGWYAARDRPPEKEFPDQFEAAAFFAMRKVEEHFEGWLGRRRARLAAIARLTE